MKLCALIKKEFHRFFHDPRLVITMLLPGILIFLLYSFLGEVIYSGESDKYEFKVYLAGDSAARSAIVSVIEGAGHTVEWLTFENEDAARSAVERGDAQAIVTFSEQFDETYGTVNIVYDASDAESSTFYALASAALTAYGMSFAVTEESITSSSEMGAQMMQVMLPFLCVCLIFSACMSVTLESVAGEKERGTLATILVTSASRRDIALGKVIPLSCISMFGAVSSFLGVACSMPKLMGVSLGFLGSYSVWSYLLLFISIVSTVPLIVSLISAVSALSRSVKEASGYTAAMMVITMVVSLLSAFVPAMGDWVYVVPVLNSVVAMQGVLAGELLVWQSLLGVGMNLLYTAILVFAITRLLSSERVMFGK